MKFAIGIDGGGSKTEAVAVDDSGAELERFTGKASNPYAVTFEQAMIHIAEICDYFFSQPKFAGGDCLGICLGLAGADNEEERCAFARSLEEYAARRGKRCRIWITNDAEIALMAALRKNSGIAAIAGTGSIVYGLTEDGTRFRVGGWGHLLGDEGSGYKIGLHTLQAVMRSYDGVYPPTRLTELTLNKLGLASAPDLKHAVYQQEMKKQHVASFAELCIRASALGDGVAINIIDDAAAELALLTLALREKHPYFQHAPIAAAGSIFKHSRRYLDTFQQCLAAKGAENPVIVSGRSSADGAAQLALLLAESE